MQTPIYKTNISRDADEELEKMLNAVNSGFSGGKVSKQDLASWILIHFSHHSLAICINDIRRDHFDQIAYVESLLGEMKTARRSGQPVQDLGPRLKPLIPKKVGQPKKRVAKGEVKNEDPNV